MEKKLVGGENHIEKKSTVLVIEEKQTHCTGQNCIDELNCLHRRKAKQELIRCQIQNTRRQKALDYDTLVTFY